MNKIHIVLASIFAEKLKRTARKSELMANAMIYGAGAIGSFVGYLLSEVTGDNAPIENLALLGRKSHIQEIVKAGLECRSSGRA